MTDNKTGTGVRCVIVTPEMTILDTHSQSITVPLFDGLRGIARGHAPFIGRLGVGSVSVIQSYFKFINVGFKFFL